MENTDSIFGRSPPRKDDVLFRSAEAGTNEAKVDIESDLEKDMESDYLD